VLIERSEKGQLLRREKVMERCRDDVERFHYCDDSRVNFSREIELQPLDAVKRAGTGQTAVHEQQLHITTPSRPFLSRCL